MTLDVIRHVTKNPDKVDFLGIYIEDDQGLSDNPYGLLGKSFRVFKSLFAISIFMVKFGNNLVFFSK